MSDAEHREWLLEERERLEKERREKKQKKIPFRKEIDDKDVADDKSNPTPSNSLVSEYQEIDDEVEE